MDGEETSSTESPAVVIVIMVMASGSWTQAISTHLDTLISSCSQCGGWPRFCAAWAAADPNFQSSLLAFVCSAELGDDDNISAFSVLHLPPLGGQVSMVLMPCPSGDATQAGVHSSAVLP